MVGSITVSPSAMRRRASTRIADVEDALLEQVADALGVLFEQPQRVARLDVLRQHEHADVGVARADPLGGDEALVGVGRGHADVDDRGVGLSEPDVAEQALGVLGLGHDLDSGVPEQADDPLACEHDVVGDDYSHGISARRVVAPTSSEPPSAPTRSARRSKRDPWGAPSSSTVMTS